MSEKLDPRSTDGDSTIEQARIQRKKAEDSRRSSDWLGEGDDLTDIAIDDFEAYLNSRPSGETQNHGIEGVDVDFEEGSNYNKDSSYTDKELDALNDQFEGLDTEDTENLSAGLDLLDDFCEQNGITGKDKNRLRTHLLEHLKKSSNKENDETKENSTEENNTEVDQLEETGSEDQNEQDEEAEAAKRLLDSDVNGSKSDNNKTEKRAEIEPPRNEIVQLVYPEFKVGQDGAILARALAKTMYDRSKSTFTPLETSQKSLDKAHQEFNDYLEAEKARYIQDLEINNTIEEKYVNPNYVLVARMKKFGESLDSDKERKRLEDLYTDNPDEYFRELAESGITLDEEADKELIERTKDELRDDAERIINKEIEDKLTDEKYKVIEMHTQMREEQAEKQSKFTKKFVEKWKKWGSQGAWGKLKKVALVGVPAFIVGAGGAFASVPLIAGMTAVGGGSALFSTYLSRSLWAKEKGDQAVDDVAEKAGPKETLDLGKAVEYVSEVTKNNRKRLRNVVTTALAAYSIGNLAGNLVNSSVGASSTGPESNPTATETPPVNPQPTGEVPIGGEVPPPATEVLTGYVDPGNGLIHELGDILNIPTDQANNLYYDLINSGSDPNQWFNGVDTYNPGPGGQPGLFQGHYEVSNYLKEALRLKGFTI